jgi:hypothetical protein
MGAGTLVSLPVPETETDRVSFACQFVFEGKHGSGFECIRRLVAQNKINVFNGGLGCFKTSFDFRFRIESKCDEADLSGEDFVLNKQLTILNLGAFSHLHIAKHVCSCVNHIAGISVEFLDSNQG